MHKFFIFLGLIVVMSVCVLFYITPNPNTDSEVNMISNEDQATVPDTIPRFLQISFPDTDFAQSDERIAKAVSGGPPKDGIPALDDPQFELLSESVLSDEIQAVVLVGESEVKVYPYSILIWHEIANDTIDGRPVSVTFCPLCGSAIVYDRTIGGEVTTLGVSGGLIESNMIMYDRVSETLWQQSTGEALAGEHFGTQLELAPFQLLTVGEVRGLYPEAQILSVDTGYTRDYRRNPYAGYNEADNQFFFEVSDFPGQFPGKEIMVVFRLGEQVVTTPWLGLESGEVKTVKVDGEVYSLEKNDGELTIVNSDGEIVPFYFEMWFSVAVQNDERDLVVVE